MRQGYMTEERMPVSGFPAGPGSQASAAADLGGLARTRLENKINDVRAARLKPGLVGHYYNSHRFSHQVMERIDPQINFAWANGAPARC